MAEKVGRLAVAEADREPLRVGVWVVVAHDVGTCRDGRAEPEGSTVEMLEADVVKVPLAVGLA